MIARGNTCNFANLKQAVDSKTDINHLSFLFKYGDPMRDFFFAVRDGGLHLNTEGVRRLRFFFINTVAHLLKW